MRCSTSYMRSKPMCPGISAELNVSGSGYTCTAGAALMAASQAFSHTPLFATQPPREAALAETRVMRFADPAGESQTVQIDILGYSRI